MKIGQEFYVLVDAQNRLLQSGTKDDGGGPVLHEDIQSAVDASREVGRYIGTHDIWIKRIKLVESHGRPDS